MFKKRKLVILPSNKKTNFNIVLKIKGSNPSVSIGTMEYVKNPNPDNEYWQGQHLYVLSDEKIEEGDWILSKNNVILKAQGYETSTDRKIIATTDESLKITKFSHYSQDLVKVAVYKDYILPKPSPAFVKKFVEEYNKGSQITDVMVKYEEYMTDGWVPTYNNPDNNNLDEPAELKHRVKIASDNTITIRKVKDSLSIDEVLDLLEVINDELPDLYSRFSPQDELNKWMEKNY